MWACSECKAIFPTEQAICPNDGASVRKAENDPLIGESIDRYRILECIGRGATGRVYLAAHAAIDRKYAVKILYGSFSSNPSFMERFRREAYSASQIRHPNVVSVEDFGTTDKGLAFLVMELVAGVTLESLIRRSAPFTPRRAAGILKQVTIGLAEAHRHGFVHRDMKPSNIMLTEAHGFEFIKILDFGAVKLPALPEAAHLTAAGFIIGTPAYMAPEQTRSGTVGPQADLYALGVILYEMLTGKLPFDGSNYTEIMMRHLESPPPPLPPSGGLERLASWLLEKLPNDRPSSAELMIKELERLEAGIRITTANPENTLVLTHRSRFHVGQLANATDEEPGSMTQVGDARPSRRFVPTQDTLIESHPSLATMETEEPEIGIQTVAGSIDEQAWDTVSIRHERSTVELRPKEPDAFAQTLVRRLPLDVHDTDGDHVSGLATQVHPNHTDTLDEPIEELLPRIHQMRQMRQNAAKARAADAGPPASTPVASSKPGSRIHWTVTSLIIAGLSVSALLLIRAFILLFGG